MLQFRPPPVSRVSITIFLLSLGLVSSAPLSLAQLLSAEAKSALRIGQASLERGDFPAAVGALEKAYGLAPDSPEVVRSLLLSYLHAGQVATALRLGRQATERWPQDPHLHHWLGLAYFKSGQNSEAHTELKQAVELDDASFGGHFDLALVQLALQDYAEASGHLEKALQIHPSD